MMFRGIRYPTLHRTTAKIKDRIALDKRGDYDAMLLNSNLDLLRAPEQLFWE